MSFTTLALIAAVAVLGPVLALRRSWHLPVVLGELAGGIALGPTGLGLLQAHNETFTFLADIGFALVMFVAGSHVPVGDRLRAALRTGVFRAVGVAAAEYAARPRRGSCLPAAAARPGPGRGRLGQPRRRSGRRRDGRGPHTDPGHPDGVRRPAA